MISTASCYLTIKFLTSLILTSLCQTLHSVRLPNQEKSSSDTTILVIFKLGDYWCINIPEQTRVLVEQQG